MHQYSPQVFLGRGKNRVTCKILPEIFTKGSEAVRGTWMRCHSTNFRRWGKPHFWRFFKNRTNLNIRRKFAIIPFIAKFCCLIYLCIYHIWNKLRPSNGKMKKQKLLDIFAFFSSITIIHHIWNKVISFDEKNWKTFVL